MNERVQIQRKKVTPPTSTSGQYSVSQQIPTALPQAVDEVPSIVHDVLNSPGQSLDEGTRAFMEPRFGHDFSQVRVHTDERAVESAEVVNALAYTVGQDVVFGEGQYEPETGEGKRLLAHELTHVVQQRSVSHGGPILSEWEQDHYEMEAHDMGVMLPLHEAQPLMSMKISSNMHVPTIQRFDPEGHREATVKSLRDSVSATSLKALQRLLIWF
jgi:Domain of unknown function (DUF4157)